MRVCDDLQQDKLGVRGHPWLLQQASAHCQDDAQHRCPPTTCKFLLKLISPKAMPLQQSSRHRKAPCPESCTRPLLTAKMMPNTAAHLHQTNWFFGSHNSCIKNRFWKGNDNKGNRVHPLLSICQSPLPTARMMLNTAAHPQHAGLSQDKTLAGEGQEQEGANCGVSLCLGKEQHGQVKHC